MERTKYVYRKPVNGKDYFYFRYKGSSKPLPHPDSPEFAAVYDVFIRQVRLEEGPVVINGKPMPNSISAAIDCYMATSDFSDLAESTKRNHIVNLETLRKNLGNTRLRDLKLSDVNRYSDLVSTEHGRGVARNHISLISMIWRTAVNFPVFNLDGKPNPTTGATKRYTEPERAHRA